LPPSLLGRGKGKKTRSEQGAASKAKRVVGNQRCCWTIQNRAYLANKGVNAKLTVLREVGEKDQSLGGGKVWRGPGSVGKKHGLGARGGRLREREDRVSYESPRDNANEHQTQARKNDQDY